MPHPIIMLALTVLFSITAAVRADGPAVAVAVTVKAPATVKAGEPIPLTITIKNNLKGEVRHSTFSLTPVSWNGETVHVSLLDVHRDGKPGSLFLRRPPLSVPSAIAGMSSHRVEPGASLTLVADAGKWQIVDGWKPGKYKVAVRVDNLAADDGRVKMSVLAESVEFEISQ